MKKRLDIPHPNDSNYTGPGERGLYIRYLNDKIRDIFGQDTEFQMEIQRDENETVFVYDGEDKIGSFTMQNTNDMRDWIFVEDKQIKKMIVFLLLFPKYEAQL